VALPRARRRGRGDPCAEADPAQEGIARINDIVIPRTREVPGFQGAYWVGDRTTGKIISIAVFDSEKHLRQTDEVSARLRQETGGTIGVKFTAVEVCEVIAEA
jgi:hypothetical protein